MNISVPVPEQILKDLLTTAVEGGSGYWASFDDINRDDDLNVLSVTIVDDDSGKRHVVGCGLLTLGLERLAAQPTPFPAAFEHLVNALKEEGDAETADVVLQMTVFGELVYG